MMNVEILMIHFQRPFKCLFTISTQLLTHFNQHQCGNVFLHFLQFGLCDLKLSLASYISGGPAPTHACATNKSALRTFSSAVLKCLWSWRNLISAPLETQTQSFFSRPHPLSILPYARVWAVNISTLWWLQVFCGQATGQAARGGTWRPTASDLSVASLFLISARRRHLLFQYFINNDCLSKQQCNYAGMDISCEVINVRPDVAVCELSGPCLSLHLAQAFPGSLCVSVLPLFSALGWAKECTVQLFPLAPTVVASCLSVSKHSSGCVATLRCVIGCLPDTPPGPAV